MTHLSVPVPSDDEEDLQNEAATDATALEGGATLVDPLPGPAAALLPGNATAAEGRGDDIAPPSPLSVGSSTQSEWDTDSSAASQLFPEEGGQAFFVPSEAKIGNQDKQVKRGGYRGAAECPPVDPEAPLPKVPRTRSGSTIEERSSRRRRKTRTASNAFTC